MKPSEEERIDIWAYSYARSSLIEAVDIIDALQVFAQQQQSKDYSRICIRSMSMSIVVLYSRPFGKCRYLKNRVRIPLNNVGPPDDLSQAHSMIISMRNQVIAHTDGYGDEYKVPNAVHLLKDDYGFQLETVHIVNLHFDLLNNCRKLCEYYIKYCAEQIKPIIEKYRVDEIDTLPAGTYELRIGSEIDDWLIPRVNQPYP